jgi:hypothetical protein
MARRQSVRQEIPSPFWFAQRLAGTLLPSTIEQLVDRHPGQWLELVGAFSDKYKGFLTAEEQTAIEERLQKALPGKLRADMERLLDSRRANVAIAERAAFAIGLEVGKRNAGGLL